VNQLSGDYTVIMYNKGTDTLYVSDNANSLYLGTCLVALDSSGERIRKEYIISSNTECVRDLRDSSSMISKLIGGYYMELNVSDAMSAHPKQYTGCERFEQIPK
jgi:hypothetical protein